MNYLSFLDETDGDFLVHLGDFSDKDICSRDHFLEFGDKLDASVVPTFVLIGNNEWK